MSKMKVFKREVQDGVAEAVKSQASIAYCTLANELIQPTGIVEPSLASFVGKVIAENKNQLDLFYLESILVSTGWNKNDDVFMPQETWAARTTPEDKQFNFMHDENDIIGHITGSYVVDKDGKRIDPSVVETPEQFDIITQAVLYNSWGEDENKERMQQIIAEIKEGKWFVSMECLFSGFDYALIDPKGSAKLLQRNEASAFLTKHLRSYGGTGVYEGYKVGRALRSIAFSGKGLVSKPANPRSVILNNKSVASFNVEEKDTITTLSIGETKMPELEKQLEQAIADLKASRAETETIKLEITKAKDREIAEKIKSFETQLTEKTSAITTLEDGAKTAKAKIDELEAALKASQKALEDSKAALDDMKKKEKMEARKASLASTGMSAEDVTAQLTSLGDLPDAAFESVLAAFKKFPPKKGADAETTTTAAPASATVTTPAITEGLETTEASLVETTTEPDKAQVAKAAMADWMSGMLLGGKKAKAAEAAAAAKK